MTKTDELREMIFKANDLIGHTSLENLKITVIDWELDDMKLLLNNYNSENDADETIFNPTEINNYYWFQIELSDKITLDVKSKKVKIKKQEYEFE